VRFFPKSFPSPLSSEHPKLTSHKRQLGIAFTANMVQPKAAANNDWFFQKVFGDGEFIAAGQLIIPPKGRKPSKGTKDNTYVRPFFSFCSRYSSEERGG